MDPRIDLVNANLTGLPPVSIVAAQIDSLRSEGELLAQRLSAAGVAVERQEYPGVTHEFFGADAVIPAAAQAQQWGGQRLRAALSGSAPVNPGAAPMPMPMPPESGERG